MSEFRATHEAPAGGLPAWTEPDGSQQPSRTIGARVTMLVRELRGDWAQVECSNGWTAWVDARKLVSTHTSSPSASPPAAPAVGAAAGFSATHRVPPGGTRAWDQPDSTRPPVATLDADLPVKVLDQRANGWAQVVCANEWKAWVDGRVLLAGSAAPATPLGPSGPSTRNLILGRTSTGPLALGGAAAVILGSFLPWLSFESESVNAWGIGLAAAISGSGSPTGVKVGIALLIVVLVGLPLLTKRGLPAIGVAVPGAVATALAVLVFVRNEVAEFSVDPGLGLLLVFGGGSAILAEFVMALQRLRKPNG